MTSMIAPVKIGLIAAGYIGAFLFAFVIAGLYVASTSGPDRQLYTGMYAFGDSLLFLGVFGLAAVPATGAAFFSLRPYRSFWRALSVAALATATTSAAALVVYLAGQRTAALPIIHTWSPLAVLRILVAPLFALAFILSGVFAPSRSCRIALFAAALIEAVIFVYVAVVWFGAG
jgi:hypothetical protein